MMEDKTQRINSLLLIYALSIANCHEAAFKYCARKLGPNIGQYPKDFEQACDRTDMTMRQLLEFALVSAVCTHNVRQVKRIPVYGRENTFLLSVTDNLL